MSRWVDLSLTLSDNPSEDIPVTIERFDHAAGARHMSEIFGIEATRLPQGLGWAGERVQLITHAGTHMDAPYHYGPAGPDGPARTIDQIPIDECVGNGVVLDVRDLADGAAITLELFRERLERTVSALRPGDIVMFLTGRDRYWGAPDYKDRGPGVTSEVVRHCVDQGIRVLGIDAWGFDKPFSAMRAEYAQSGDPSVIWPAHYAGRQHPYLQLEKLCNLHELVGRKSRVFCAPIKLQAAGAGWCRVFAEVWAGAVYSPRSGTE
jgi:kynurenine formamidase